MKSLLKVMMLSLFKLHLLGQAPHFNQHDFSKTSEGEINVLQQGTRGFLWIGTTDGLYRYDGFTFKSFHPGDTVTDFNVSTVYGGDSTRIWVGCESGHVYAMSMTGSFELLIPEEEVTGKRITGLVIDHSGQVWISTYGAGLFVMSSRKLHHLDREDGLIDDEIYGMALSHDGSIWVATDNGVSICRFDGEEKVIHNLRQQDGLNDEIVFALQPDEHGMWIGFESNGFCYYHSKTGEISRPVGKWTGGPVTGFATFQNHSNWIATEHEGIYRGQGTDIETYESLIIPDVTRIDDLLADREGNIWIASRNQLYSAQINIELWQIPHGEIQAVLENEDGDLWLGTQNGLYIKGNAQWTKHSGIDANVISLYEDRYHQIWIGTFGQGVAVWNPATEKCTWLSESNGLKNGSILDIDGYGDRVWLATLGGIVEVNNHELSSGSQLSFLNMDESNGLSASFFYSVFADDKGRIWFGTDGDGILVMENEIFKSLLLEKGIPAKTVYCFNQDQDGDIWAGTADNGVFHIYQDTFKHYTSSDGLRNMSISAIGIDDQNQIILVHSEGFDILNKANQRIKHYGSRVGADDLNPAMNAIHHPGQSQTWIGGSDKLIRHTCLGHLTANYPGLVLNDVSVMGRSVETHFPGTFGPDDHFIEIEYSGIWLSNPDEISYEYTLSNYDMEWKSTSDRQISYSQLGPGTYEFLVRPVLHGQAIDEAEIQYAFVIKPPLWLRPIFFIPVVILAGLLLYWMQKYRERKVTLEATLARERIESQYEVLKSQINPHFLFNSFNTLASIVEENATDAITYIEKLSDYYRSIIQFRNHRTINLEDELKLIHDFIFLLKHRYSDNLLVHVDIKNMDGLIPPLALQMLLENAVKHNVISKSRPLRVVIKDTDDRNIIVENNLQPKKSKPESTRFGLQNIRTQFGVLTKREVLIKKSEAYFTVQIPILKQA